MRQSSTATSSSQRAVGLGADRFPAGGGRSAYTRRGRPAPNPNLLSKHDAATALGMSVRHFERHVQSELRCVYSGQLTLYHLHDLEQWAEDEATLEGRAIHR